MNIPVFEQQLAAMSLFPEAVIAYARSVGADLSEKSRAALAHKLALIYSEFEPIEHKRMKLQEEALSAVITLRKKALPAIHRDVEKSEQDAVLNTLEHDMRA